MTWATFIIGLIGPLATRLLLSLGLSLVTITGVTVTVNALRDTLVSSLGGTAMDSLQLAGLFGFWTCIGMVLGSVSFVLAFNSAKGFIALAKT